VCPRLNISTILGTSNPTAIGAFAIDNGLTSSTVYPGQTYFIPDPDAPAPDGAEAVGQAILNGDNQRLAALAVGGGGFAPAGNSEPAQSQNIIVDTGKQSVVGRVVDNGSASVVVSTGNGGGGLGGGGYVSNLSPAQAQRAQLLQDAQADQAKADDLNGQAETASEISDNFSDGADEPYRPADVDNKDFNETMSGGALLLSLALSKEAKAAAAAAAADRAAAAKIR
jgi:hypothetical protein